MEADAHTLSCHIQRSIRYHRARERFFEFWASAASALSFVGSSAVIATVLSSAPEWGVIVSGSVTAFVQLVELVGRVSQKARIHAGLAGEFVAAERSLALTDPTDQLALARLRAEILSIEAREPPVKRYLDVLCHNAVAQAIGSDDIYRVPPFGRIFAQYISGEGAQFQLVQKPVCKSRLEST